MVYLDIFFKSQYSLHIDNLSVIINFGKTLVIFVLSNLFFRTLYNSFASLRPISVSSYTNLQVLQFLSSAGLDPPTSGLQIKRLDRWYTDAIDNAVS